MPYYPSSNRKSKATKSSRNTSKAHSRECVVKQPVKSQSYSKETIREVTIKLMALMKAKRECQPLAAE